jgi:hypothetical protein
VIGRVVDEAGDGVGGALVRAEPGPHEVTTSADGSFRFESLSARRYSVFARSDRFYAWPMLVDEDPVTLQLQLGATFVVHVFADRAPVAGAELRLQHGFKATTDALGRAEVRGLAPIAYEGALRANGFAEQRIHLSLHEDPGGIVERTFQLERGAPPRARPIEHRLRAAIATMTQRWRGARSTRIAGCVVDDRGDPARAAIVRVFGHRLVRSDGNGRFDVDDLDPGEYEVSAQWDGPWLESRGDRGIRQRVTTGDTNVDLVLATGAAIRGRVTLDGEPVPYFGLRLLAPQESTRGGRPIGVRTTDGRFEVQHVFPGTWRIAVIAPSTRVTISSEVTITSNETIDVGELALRRGLRIGGRVRDESGAAIVDAQVWIGRMWDWMHERSSIERMFTGVYETRTDTDGAYAFAGVDVLDETFPTSEIILATHHRVGVSVMHELPKTDATVDLVLLGSGRIEGVVQQLRGGHGFMVAERAGEPARARHASCDASARFTFEDVPAGEYVVKLEPETEAAPVRVTVVANQTATATVVMNSVAVKLTILVPVGRGKDLVIEPSSEAAAIGGNIRSIVKMGAEERCSLEYVQPGSYRVSLDGARWRSIDITSSPAEQTIDLR